MESQDRAASVCVDETNTLFDQEWNVDSPTKVFANTRPLIRRAWERQPRTRHIPVDSLMSEPALNKSRTIWKRYDYQSIIFKPVYGVGSDATKVVKKLKLAPETQLSAVASSIEMPCRWERRRSSLPHKPLHRSKAASSTSSPTTPDRPNSELEDDAQRNGIRALSEPPCHVEAEQPVYETKRVDETTTLNNEEKVKTRLKSSTSSFFSRRKTDFVFSHVPVLSPSSRKRRLSDNLDSSQRSIFVTALYAQQPKARSEPDAGLPVLEHINQSLTDRIIQPSVDSGNDTKYKEAPLSTVSEEQVAAPDINVSSPTSSQGQNMDGTLRSGARSEKALSTPTETLPNPQSLEQSDTVVFRQSSPAGNGSDADDGHGEEQFIASEPHNGVVDVINLSDSPHLDPDAIQLVTGSTQGNNDSACTSTSDEHQSSTVKIVLNDDDTDILHDFLNRAKASKAAKIAEQSSEINRRDSDVVKHALASPRKPLDDLDTNSPSPRKQQEVYHLDRTLDVHIDSDKRSPSRSLEYPQELQVEADVLKPSTLIQPDQPTRRSKRNTSAPPIPTRSSSYDAAPPSAISLRRQDQTDAVVLKKTEAQELALLTRTNTRRNKGSAMHARFMLERLNVLPPTEGNPEALQCIEPVKVRWSERLVAYFQESNTASTQPDNVDSLASTEPSEVSRPRARRAKMLGAMNGTPAKQRTRDMETPTLLLDDCSEADVPGTPPAENVRGHGITQANTTSKSTSERSITGVPVASDKKSESSQQQATPRARRRLPTPAKPATTEKPSQNIGATRTRHTAPTGQTSIPTSIAIEDKENRGREVIPASKHETSLQDVSVSKRGSVQPTSHSSTSEARRRPEVPRRAVAPNTGIASPLRASGRLRR